MIKAQNDKGTRRTSCLGSEETSQTRGANGESVGVGGGGGGRGKGKRKETGGGGVDSGSPPVALAFFKLSETPLPHLSGY